MTLARHIAIPEKQFFLWLMAAGPAIWAAHFFLTYVTAAIWCARFAGPGGSLGLIHTAVFAYTAAALAVITLVSLSAYRRHGRGFTTDEHGMDTPGDRHRFLGFATLLLAGLSAVATIYGAVSVLIIDNCS